ncbi:MAG: galactokinase [Myxococcales bacterium]
MTKDPASVARQTFAAHFGPISPRSFRAPGRVNLIGEHTDYNLGFVLPCALDFHTVVAAARPARSQRQVRVVAADLGEQDHFSLDEPISPSAKPWSNFVRGVVKEVLGRGHPLGSIDLVVSGNVPRGAGLSSSAALEVALGWALRAVFELPLSDLAIAQIGQAAENDFVGCRSGIMDQLVSACGEREYALLIDCRSLDFTLARVPDGMAIMVADSRITRNLASSEYNVRRVQCENAARRLGVSSLRELDPMELERARDKLDPLLFKRARHVVNENARALEAAKALARSDIPALGKLMAASHASLRDDFEVSVPAVDALVEIVQDVVGEQGGGARMTGGGFGGCVVALVPEERVTALENAIALRYPNHSGGHSAHVYVGRPSAGACELTSASQA